MAPAENIYPSELARGRQLAVDGGNNIDCRKRHDAGIPVS